MLKKSLAIFFIISYSLLTIKSFIPQLVYSTNLDYIIKYLCEQKDEEENLCMGQCYLSKKIQEETKKEEQSPESTAPKTFEIHYALLELDENLSKSSGNKKVTFQDLQLTLLLNPQKPNIPPPKKTNLS